MALSSIGDMARSFHMRLNTSDAKSDLARLADELASGQHSDLGTHLNGDFTALSEIERGLKLLDAYDSSANEAALLTTTAQAALEALQGNLDELAPALLAVVGAGSLTQMEIVADSASDRLVSIITSLNQDAAGRSVFSGDATDTKPLISAAEIMVELETVAAGASDATDLISELESWFMTSGGGFETTAFQGNTGNPPGFLLGEGEMTSNPLTALDDGIRMSLMGMALASLISEGHGPSADTEKERLLEQAALWMIDGNGGVTSLRADLGHAESRIDEAKARNDGARAIYQLEYNQLTTADPYEVATELQDAQTRLENLYLLTSRLSQLSLTEYLR